MRNDSRTLPDPLGSLGLTPAQTTLYTAVLRLHRASLAELAEAMNHPEEPLGEQLAALVRLGVVDRQSGEYFARHPAAALGRLIAERLDRLAAESRQIDSALGSISDLARDYDAGQDHQRGPFPVELVNGAEELFESMVGMAVDAPPLQVCSAIPDHRTMADFAHKYADTWIDAQRHGRLSLRTIIPASSLSVPGLAAKLRALDENGATTRALDKVPSWFLTAGNDTAGLPAVWGGNLPEHAYKFYFVRAPIVVGVMRELFDELWARAEPMPWAARPADGVVRVLRLAAQGLCDESIARHLGVSVRTVRARFADAMAELGARSRFHAGVRAARRGWLEEVGH
ncbi:LuxR family transcriptional regulator [Spongiactinospora sp. TRM90649]|uniref:helix-turn-helix transcriptional regulator n=1 Tax=Spongiactinospora sp. TRM90649 TaxID=3031114 RepID=UPI0023F9B1DE|nr:LuxR family transcriptional regulator [Spongiactinospora sp. TRM90649]MDF5751456.1 LuxR C-terminal-related transcriptional regulator [Spongiactinospora sp. TRM90649]